MSGHAPGNKNVQIFKYTYSTMVLIFSAVLVIGAVFTRQTELSEDSYPIVALLVLVFSITWLTMVEGGQGAIVGLGPVAHEHYARTHPHALHCTSLVHKGDNLDRYLLGRQFMVILIVFAVEMAGATPHFDELWNLPDWLTAIFLKSGLAMILFTCMVGQLNSEVNGCHCMLDYINNYFAIVTVYVALAIEFTGILHATYLIQRMVASMAGQPIVSKEPERTTGGKVFFWGRCAFSVFLLIFSLAVTFEAIFRDDTAMFDGVPAWASVIIFLVLLIVIGHLEGSQIAYFAVSKLQKSERGDKYFAVKTCQCIFKNNNHNLGAFIIGRQLCVVSCMFFIARITAIKLEKDDSNIFGVPDGLQAVFDTGICGAIIVAIIGSISWRLIASAFPVAFLSTPFTYVLLRFCLFIEKSGILHGAYVIAAIHKKLAGFQRDEHYIGTAEERANALKKDDSQAVLAGAGHIIPELDTGENPIEGIIEDDENESENMKDIELEKS